MVDADDVFYDSSETFELDVDAMVCQSAVEESLLSLLFPDLELASSAPASPITPPSRRAGSMILSHRLRKRRAPSHVSMYDDSDQMKGVSEQTQFFVPLPTGTGIDHVFVNRDTLCGGYTTQTAGCDPVPVKRDVLSEQHTAQTANDISRNVSASTNPLETSTTQISDNTSRSTSASTFPLETPADTGLSSPVTGIAESPLSNADFKDEVCKEASADKNEMEGAEVAEEEADALLKENRRIQEENTALKDVWAELEQTNGDLEARLKDEMQLQEEHANLRTVWWELEQRNTDLEVKIKEQTRIIELYVGINNNVETTNNILKSQLSQMRQDAIDDITMLKQQIENLEMTNDGLEARMGSLADQVADRDIQIGNYEKVFESFKVQWKEANEKNEELQHIIQAFPDHPKALLEAVIKRDERIARLKEAVKANRVCDKALKRAYPMFAAKHNNVVGLANDRLDVGVMLSRRLAQLEAYLLQEGHASPIVDREQVWNEVWTVFRINENGLWEENQAGQPMIVLKEDEVADTPDGWLPEFLKKAWMEEGEVVEDDLNTSTEEDHNNTCNAEGHETLCVDEG